MLLSSFISGVSPVGVKCCNVRSEPPMFVAKGDAEGDGCPSFEALQWYTLLSNESNDLNA